MLFVVRGVVLLWVKGSLEGMCSWFQCGIGQPVCVCVWCVCVCECTVWE